MGIENAYQGGGDVGAGGDRERTLVLVGQPIEITPHFAAIDRARAGLLAHRAQSRDGAQGDGYMRVVLVGQVMQVHHLRPGGAEDGAQVAGQRPGRVFDLAARVAKLDLAGVIADEGGFALLLDAHPLHLLIAQIGVDAGARAAGAVGRHHAGKPSVHDPETLGDTVVGHDFDIVLVRGNRQVGGAGQRLGGRQTIGNEHVNVGIVRKHWGPP